MKYVYLFSEGNGGMRELLGGKGANLAEMVNLGMPVPMGFTVTTEACTKYYEDGETIAPEANSNLSICPSLRRFAAKFGTRTIFACSVRSGKSVHADMMDTILNLGLNDTVAQGMVSSPEIPVLS